MIDDHITKLLFVKFIYHLPMCAQLSFIKIPFLFANETIFVKIEWFQVLLDRIKYNFLNV